MATQKLGREMLTRLLSSVLCAPFGDSGYNTPLRSRALEVEMFRRAIFKRALMLGFVVALTLAVSAPWAISEQAQEESRVPAFNPGPPPKGEALPPILDKDQLWGNNDQYPYQSHAYELAAKIPNVIYQQPCYCYCDRMGHKSLRSCFEGTHGAQCSTCMKELYYAYQMTKEHKTAAQIRKGIIAGEWKQIDLQTAANIN